MASQPHKYTSAGTPQQEPTFASKMKGYGRSGRRERKQGEGLNQHHQHPNPQRRWGGTGAGTTAILSEALTGVPRACRGLHITLAAARMESLTEERAADVLATAERHLRA